jgi:hypothetical protein
MEETEMNKPLDEVARDLAGSIQELLGRDDLTNEQLNELLKTKISSENLQNFLAIFLDDETLGEVVVRENGCGE